MRTAAAAAPQGQRTTRDAPCHQKPYGQAMRVGRQIRQEPSSLVSQQRWRWARGCLHVFGTGVTDRRHIALDDISAHGCSLPVSIAPRSLIDSGLGVYPTLA